MENKYDLAGKVMGLARVIHTALGPGFLESVYRAHSIQLVNHLTATGIEEGLLLNFGAASLEYRKKFRTFQPKAAAES